MKTSVILLQIAGILCVPFIVFHALFAKFFNWNQALECLSVSDRAILFTYHYISILILFFMFIVCLFQAKVVLASKIKYNILGFFALFFLIRILTEFTLFGVNSGTPVIIAMCAIPAFCFVYPLFVKPTNEV
ncbi:MAG: hypothetical protein JXA77_09455 [Bacteroidales bacterium]|nr:hypothetical protein [Bacteroidales bacterium]MBN2817395.1 hypothetical protein [Bacteroidales bacterium]